MGDQEFTVQRYKEAIDILQHQGKWTTIRQKMLTFQYNCTERTMIEPELTRFMGWAGHKGNSDYGRLGKLVGARLLDEDAAFLAEGWPFLSSGEWRESDDEFWPGRRFYWTMRPALAQALEELGLVGPPAEGPDIIQPEFGEVPPEHYPEGATKQVTVNAYERNRAARAACIDYHGTLCTVCDSDLAEFYGPVAEGFIHVHHLKPLSEIGERYTVNPETDLAPVCPNCHAMLHRRTPPYTIEELRAMIQEAHR